MEKAAGVGALANSYKAFIEAATTEIEDRKKKAEAEMQLSPLGVMIRDIEEHCPADFYKDKSLYADFDHLKEYIQRFMLRPLNNLLTAPKKWTRNLICLERRSEYGLQKGYGCAAKPFA